MPTCALIFAVIWVLGSISSYTLGGFIHVLLALAVAMMITRVVVGRKVTE